MVKVSIIKVIQVSTVRIGRRLRLLTPRKKAAAKAFQRLISGALICLARCWRRAISSSNRKKMIRVTISERAIIKKARITTVGE
jgi:hypothetical protein